MQSNPFDQNNAEHSYNISSNLSLEAIADKERCHTTQWVSGTPQEVRNCSINSVPKNSSPLEMKDFSICLTPFDMVFPSGKVHKPLLKRKLLCLKLGRHSLFNSIAEE